MPRKRTRRELKVLQGYYAKCCGWEDLEYYEITGDYEKDKETNKELNEELKLYRINQPEYKFRIITRYEQAKG